MEIKEFYKLNEAEQEYWTTELAKCDWSAGEFLHELVSEKKFHDFCGKGSEVLIMTEGEKLASFCTFAEHDEIPDDSMKPWIGFVYTFPEFRGNRCSGKLCEYAAEMAKKAGYKTVYVSSEEKGLYEKYGFTFLDNMMSQHGYTTQVFKRNLK